MKKILLTAVVFLSLGSAFAQSEPNALPATLPETMSAMSKCMKTVTVQANDPKMNANSANLVDQFVALTLHSKDFVPKYISTLPADQQAANKAAYDKMLDKTADLGHQLSIALRANDNATANILLNQLVQAKKDGHGQFNR
ncbi:MAG: hypothetical protein ACXVCY_08180 [Pseudobdellovibrionaceae bacterium]